MNITLRKLFQAQAIRPTAPCSRSAVEILQRCMRLNPHSHLLLSDVAYGDGIKHCIAVLEPYFG